MILLLIMLNHMEVYNKESSTGSVRPNGFGSNDESIPENGTAIPVRETRDHKLHLAQYHEKVPLYDFLLVCPFILITYPLFSVFC